MTPSRKVLYLDPEGKLEVAREGPALRVSRPDRASRWYPLGRLARVVSRREVRWKGEAILACLEAQVPLVFLDAEGRVCGLCVGRSDDVVSLQSHLDAVLAGPDWRERWNNWFRSQERRVIVNLHLALGWQIGDLRPAAVALRLDTMLADRIGRDRNRRCLGRLRALLSAQVAEGLQRCGIAPERVCGIQGGLNLGREMTRLLSWPLRGRVLRRPPDQHDLEGLARYYQERLELPLDRSLRRLVEALWKLPL